MRKIYNAHKVVFWAVGALLISGFVVGVVWGIWDLILGVFAVGIGAPILIKMDRSEERQAQKIEEVKKSSDEAIDSIYEEAARSISERAAARESANERKRKLMNGIDDV